MELSAECPQERITPMFTTTFRIACSLLIICGALIAFLSAALLVYFSIEAPEAHEATNTAFSYGALAGLTLVALGAWGIIGRGIGR